MKAKMAERLFDEPEDEVLLLSAGAGHAGMRLDSFVQEATAGSECPVSRSRAAKLCSEGRVLIDGRPGTKNDRLAGGAAVAVLLPAPEPDRVGPEDIPLDVVYEDGDIIVVDKPSGMVVHPAPGHTSGTLCSALLFHCAGSLSGIGGVSRPGIVHRIDRDTSGLIVCAKNDAAHISLSAQLKDRTVHRTYYAILCGNPRDDAGTVDAPVGRHPSDRKRMAVLSEGDPGARPAVTYWRILERYPGFCLTECRLGTGRTHQIRVHMAHIGHPVFGDPVYGGDRTPFYEKHKNLTRGQCLHAGRLELVHPRTGERMRFECPLPPETVKLLGILRASAGIAAGGADGSLPGDPGAADSDNDSGRL